LRLFELGAIRLIRFGKRSTSMKKLRARGGKNKGSVVEITNQEGKQRLPQSGPQYNWNKKSQKTGEQGEEAKKRGGGA